MNKYPLIRFVIIFIAGITAQSIFQFQNSYLISSLVFSICFQIFLLFLKPRNKESIKNVFIYLVVLLFGSTYYSAFTIQEIKYPFDKPKLPDSKIYGIIDNIELKKEGRITFNLIADSLKTKEKKYYGSFKILCSIYDADRQIETLFDRLSVGNKIILNGIVQKARDERNPGEFDYEKYLYSKGIVALANSYKVSDLKITSAETEYFPNLVFRIRKIIDEKIGTLHNKTTAGLLRGLILADRKSIENEIKNQFVNAGVVHVLSVSGLHVGYIVLIFIFAFGRLSISTRYILTVVGLLFYLIITGADAPVFRSTVMVLIALAAPAFGRDYNSLNALALSAFVILLINPNELFNPSFQLSFSAILSLIILFPPINNWVKNLDLNSKMLKWLLIFLGSSVAAQIGTLPFTLTYFHRLSVTSLLANFIVIPVSGMIVGLGILTLLIGSIFTTMGSVIASSNELLTYFMYWFVGLMGSEKYSYLMINQFTVYDAIVFYMILGLIFYLLKKFENTVAKTTALIFSLFLSVLLMQADNNNPMPQNLLSIMAIDVGQGDSFLVKFPNGKTALIDAGNKTSYFDNGERVILPLLDKFGIDTIDYGFVSHVDSDHYGGFEAIIMSGRVKLIYKPGLDSLSSSDLNFEKYLRHYKCPIKYYRKEALQIGNSRIYVLNDTINNYFETLKSNDKSGMLKLVYGRTSFLFTGDAGVKVEEVYQKKYGSFLKSDLLKAGHHGSKSSTSYKFLQSVNPRYALISAGVANKFGHPDKLILDRLAGNNIQIMRTDINGAILIQSDGNKISLVDWKRSESGFNF